MKSCDPVIICNWTIKVVVVLCEQGQLISALINFHLHGNIKLELKGLSLHMVVFNVDTSIIRVVFYE